jgi:signal transduction histidine kinase
MASIFLVGINFQLYFKETRQHYKPRVKTTLVYSMYIYALLQLGVFMLPPYLDTPQNTFSHLEELFFLAGMALKLIHLVGLTQYGQAFYADYSYKIHMFNRAALTKDATDQLAHELQTPLLELKVRLTNIFGEESNDTEETKERKGIENLVEQISSLIHGFQRFHQDQLGDGARHPSICNLNVACDTSLYALKIALRPKIKFNKNYNSGTTLVAIESELDQILRNLIKNAIESVEEKRKLAREMGIIHFETFVEHGRSGDALFVGVNIEDNGVGINADIIDSIFEEGVTTKDGYGRGHGLFIVKTLVERNGGSASATNITSNGETTGASFVVRFPFAAKKASDKPEESSSSVRNSPIPQRQKLSSFAKDGAKTFDHGSEIPRN